MVLDVSLSCAWCFADEASEAAWAILSRLQNAPADVPSLWLWETANVLLEALPIHIDHASTATIWHDTLALALARAHRLTSYDAAYLELALRLGLPLASRDQALQAAARSEGVPPLPT
jgi:predicted nucleic acid-binding protein